MGFTTYYSITAIFQLKYLHYMIFLAMFAHIFGYLATPIYLLVNVKEKNTATYVFTDFTNLSGWESPGVRIYSHHTYHKHKIECSQWIRLVGPSVF